MTYEFRTPLLEVDRQSGRPVTLQARIGASAPAWAARHRRDVRALVAEHGALLIRGLGLHDRHEIAAVFRRLAGDLMAEREVFAPRRSFGDRVYSATIWPPGLPMCLHHELSYAAEFPGLIMFVCRAAAPIGGATRLADAGSVLDALPPTLVRRFEREGWLLIRNYHDEVGATIAGSFGTTDRAAVAAYCRANAIDFTWTDGGGLRTMQRRNAVVTHPRTGRRCWFNQIAFLNDAVLEPEIRAFLLDLYGPDGLPFTTRFGNGDPIADDVIQLINSVYEAHTLRARWQDGDLLVVDNVRIAHGRDPFDGPREVVVAMADPMCATPAPAVGSPGP